MNTTNTKPEQAYEAHRRLVHGWTTNTDEDVEFVCQSAHEAHKLMEHGWQKLTQNQLGKVVDAVSTSALYSERVIKYNSFRHLTEAQKKQLVEVVSGKRPNFGQFGANLTIRIGHSDAAYFRPWNDAEKGGVWNTLTLNRHLERVAGGWTGENASFPIFSAEEAADLLEKGKAVARGLFEAGEGTNFAIFYDADQQKLVVQNTDNGRDYLIDTV